MFAFILLTRNLNSRQTKEKNLILCTHFQNFQLKPSMQDQISQNYQLAETGESPNLQTSDDPKSPAAHFDSTSLIKAQTINSKPLSIASLTRIAEESPPNFT